MANGNGEGLWKWIATTLGGTLFGIVGMGLVSMNQFDGIMAEFRTHERKPGHEVMETRVASLETDIEELKDLLREAIRKMDDYHRQ